MYDLLEYYICSNCISSIYGMSFAVLWPPHLKNVAWASCITSRCKALKKSRTFCGKNKKIKKVRKITQKIRKIKKKEKKKNFKKPNKKSEKSEKSKKSKRKSKRKSKNQKNQKSKKPRTFFFRVLYPSYHIWKHPC